MARSEILNDLEENALRDFEHLQADVAHTSSAAVGVSAEQDVAPRSTGAAHRACMNIQQRRGVRHTSVYKRKRCLDTVTPGEIETKMSATQLDSQAEFRRAMCMFIAVGHQEMGALD